MSQQYEQKVYTPAEPGLIEVTFNPSTMAGNKSLGYGQIKTNGISFFYSVYPSATSPQGIFIAPPSKKKLDGTYENQVVILGPDNRAIYEDIVLQEMARQGIRVTPGTPAVTPYSNQSQVKSTPAKAAAPRYTAPEVDDDLPF